MVERICYNQEKTNQNINIIKNTRCRSASIEVPDMKCLPVKNLSGLKQLERSLADSTTAKNYVMLPKTVWRHCVMLIFILQEVVIAYVGGSTKKEAVESAWKKTGDDSALRHVNWTGRNYNRGGNPPKFRKVPVCKSKIVKHMMSNQRLKRMWNPWNWFDNSDLCWDGLNRDPSFGVLTLNEFKKLTNNFVRHSPARWESEEKRRAKEQESQEESEDDEDTQREYWLKLT